MSTEPGKRFTTSQRGVIGVAASLAVIAALVLVYKGTAPSPGGGTAAGGTPASESDVLQVGALPVT
jgi:hypothetical protein